MTRRQRLMATLLGQPVDRPAVSFYEVGGFAVSARDPDPYNIYNDPSWRPLLELAEAKTDLIRMRSPRITAAANPAWQTESWEEGATRFWRRTVRAGGRTLTSLQRRDAAVSTLWTLEHLLKDPADLRAFLDCTREMPEDVIDVSPLLEEEQRLGDSGIVMVDTPDPLCLAAMQFSMEDFTMVAFTERALFHQLLERYAEMLLRRTRAVAAAFPRRLWRIYGPEYASEPFLPEELFVEYVVRYTGPMIAAIHAHGGFVRLHCHGRISKLLKHFVAMGADATDPIEPPPQGDVLLADVRREFGKDLVLFGNLEVADIENLPAEAFAKVVRQALADGTAGAGRGFVLLPSAAPYGREISPRTLENYRVMVREVEGWGDVTR